MIMIDNLRAFGLGALCAFCNYNDDHLKKFRLLNSESVMDTISTSDIHQNYIVLPDGRKVPSGSIIQRPLSNLFFQNEFFHHEGVVLGTSKKNEIKILEMNDSPRNGINIVDLNGFLGMYNFSDFLLRHEPNPAIEVSVLLDRAKKYDLDPYNISSLNCIDFAHYLVYEKKKLSFNERQLEVCDIVIKSLKSIITASQYPTKEDFIRQLNKIENRKIELRRKIEEFEKSN
jgi:hypothetical protein